MKHTLHLTLSLTIALLFNHQTATAQPKKILIGTDAWPPFRFVTQNNISGIDDDLWQKLSQAMNFKIEYIRCPWKRCLDMMRSGQIDAMSGLAWREARAVYIEYTNPAYYRCSPRFYLRRGEEHILKNQQDLSKLNIGMVRGSAYYPAFDNNDALQKTQMTQEHVLLQLLAAQRIDTYVGTDCQADYELAHSQWKQSFKKHLTHQITKHRFISGSPRTLYGALNWNDLTAISRKYYSRVFKTRSNRNTIAE